MKAVKDNKVYTIDKTSAKAYLAQGYDIADDNFNVIEHSPLATVPYSEYAKVKTELGKVKAELEELKTKQPKK